MLAAVPTLAALPVRARSAQTAADARWPSQCREYQDEWRVQGGDVPARTINGPLHVVLTGARWDGAGLDAETTNGPGTSRSPRGTRRSSSPAR